MALVDYYKENVGVSGRCPPIIFMGVTYPVGMGLVDCLRSRCEPREICGVAYGADGLRAIVSMIYHKILPERKIRFIYFNDYPQDVEAAQQLERTRLYKEGQVEVVLAKWDSIEPLIEDKDLVYVSWFTFESIFEETSERADKIRTKLKDKIVVATTRLNCMNRNAVAACCADDVEVGEEAAALLISHLNGKVKHLGERDVVLPPIKYWLNMDKAKRLGISFTESQIKDAAEVYGERVD